MHLFVTGAIASNSFHQINNLISYGCEWYQLDIISQERKEKIKTANKTLDDLDGAYMGSSRGGSRLILRFSI